MLPRPESPSPPPPRPGPSRRVRELTRCAHDHGRFSSIFACKVSLWSYLTLYHAISPRDVTAQTLPTASPSLATVRVPCAAHADHVLIRYFFLRRYPPIEASRRHFAICGQSFCHRRRLDSIFLLLAQMQIFWRHNRLRFPLPCSIIIIPSWRRYSPLPYYTHAGNNTATMTRMLRPMLRSSRAAAAKASTSTAFASSTTVAKALASGFSQRLFATQSSGDTEPPTALAKLHLEDGTTLVGKSFGSHESIEGEVRKNKFYNAKLLMSNSFCTLVELLQLQELQLHSCVEIHIV